MGLEIPALQRGEPCSRRERLLDMPERLTRGLGEQLADVRRTDHRRSSGRRVYGGGDGLRTYSGVISRSATVKWPSNGAAGAPRWSRVPGGNAPAVRS